MTTTHEAVLSAAKAKVAAALPNADVKRNASRDTRVGPGGLVILRDGDPGDPEVDLSPVRYNYERRIPLEFFAYETASKSREAVLDEMMRAVAAAFATDRTLGGRCEWIEPEAPTYEDLDIEDAETVGSADTALIASYATADPIG